MSGALKPSVTNLGLEVTPTIVAYLNLSSSKPSGLFDGIYSSGYTTSAVCTWTGSTHYATFTIPKKCNIYRLSTLSNYNGNLKITDVNSGLDVTSNYSITLATSGTANTWTKFVSNLPAGTYKFEYNGASRSDAEWYIEDVSCKYLIHSMVDDKNYTISSESLVETTVTTNADKYINGFFIEALTNTILSSTTLKALSPFKLISYTLSGDTFTKITLNAIKTNSELIMSKQTISIKPAQSVTKFFIDKTLVNNGEIYTVVSIDSGLTWKVWNGASWINLTNTVVNKTYSTMTTEEKTQRDIFKNEIISSGMSSSILETADFNSIGGINLKFAYVLQRPTYADGAILTDLKWTYLAKDTWNLLSTDSDITISVNEDFVKLTPIRDIDSTVKINILT